MRSRRLPAPTLDVFWDDPYDAEVATDVAPPDASRDDLACGVEIFDRVQDFHVTKSAVASTRTFRTPDFG